MPAHMRGEVPLVIQPETHIAGELKALLAERRLALRCEPARAFAAVVVIMALRALVQRLRSVARPCCSAQARSFETISSATTAFRGSVRS